MRGIARTAAEPRFRLHTPGQVTSLRPSGRRLGYSTKDGKPPCPLSGTRYG
jgi:hypothetical protein